MITIIIDNEYQSHRMSHTKNVITTKKCVDRGLSMYMLS